MIQCLRVNLVISQGPEVTTVNMPVLINMPIDEAKNTITGLGLVVGEVTPQPSENVEKDLVIWQSYEKNTELETGTAVDLYISSGPAETPIDNGEDDKEISTSLTMNPLPDREETEMVIYRIQDGVTDIVFNEKHKASDGAFVITLHSKVGARFDIYYDGVYQGNKIAGEQ